MPMTSDDWKGWSLEKRQFYARLFTCYQITRDGMLCIDTTRRQKLVRDQLDKQASKGVEPIIGRSKLVNYILVGDFLEDGKVKDEDEINVIYLERTSPNKASSEPVVQNTLVGGEFYSQTTHEGVEHFAAVLKQKMCNGAALEAASIAERATCLTLGITDDLTVFSRCVLDEGEGFLLKEREFEIAIAEEAGNLLRGTNLKLSVEMLSKQIISHILCSHQTSPQVSLPSLSVPNIHTYVAFYPTKFSQVESYVKDIKTVKEDVSYKPQFLRLVDCLSEGPFKFYFQSEYLSLLKLSLLLKSLTGKSFEEMTKCFEMPIAKSGLVPAMLGNIAKTQAANIREALLPPPPFFMGTEWDFRRSATAILDILMTRHCINLNNMAEMAGISPETAYLVLGFASNDLLLELNQDISRFWEENSAALLVGVRRFLEKQHVASSVAKLSAQPAGIHLGLELATSQRGPGSLSVFAKSVMQPGAAAQHPVGLEKTAQKPKLEGIF